MKNARRVIISMIAFAFVTALLVCWTWLTGGRLSDVFDLFGRRRTLALQRLPDGNTFRVLQHWNGIDFYTTEFQHQSPQDDITTIGLDADDDRRESVALSVDERLHTASVNMGKETTHLKW